MCATLGFLTPPKPPPVDVSAHLEPATTLLFVGTAAVVAFFVIRPELWRRLWFERVDPRPAGLLRITLGITALWTFFDLWMWSGHWLFTDEGLWLTEMARKNYGGKLRELWDPVHGFEHWTDVFVALADKFSLLHLRSDPPFALALFALLGVSGTMMVLGLYSRTATVITWFLVNNLYNYSPIYYAGGDTVLRVSMFLALFLRSGEAYSIDSFRRRRRLILGGAASIPPLRRIPAWPQRLFMLQLAIIYCATGLLKTGGTWVDGSALYYALNLDHFYRIPMTGLVTLIHYSGLGILSSWIVHWWEISFPLALVCVMVGAYERDRSEGTWPQTPRWRRALGISCLIVAWVPIVYVGSWGAYYHWPKGWLPSAEVIRWLTLIATISVPVFLVGGYLLLRKRTPRVHAFVLTWLFGKRLWLGIGVLLHLGIELGLNVGTFVQVMLAVYPAWLRGPEVDPLWRTIYGRAAAAGEAGRPPIGTGRIRRIVGGLRAPLDHLRFRVARPKWTVLHGESETAIRHAALLRCFDVGQRLEFASSGSPASLELALRAPNGQIQTGDRAGRVLCRFFPAMWLLLPLCWLPGVGRLAVLCTYGRPRPT